MSTSATARSGWPTSKRSKAASTVKDIKNLPDLGKLYAAHVIHDLYRFTAGKALVVTDVGQHQMWEAQYYKHDYPRKLITSGGLGTMGFALPAAIGAKFAQPGDSVWVICGDGGFQMTAAELSTCAQEGIKVNVAIINNGFLGMVRQWQEFLFWRPLRRDADAQPGFREARRSAQFDRHSRREAIRSGGCRSDGGGHGRHRRHRFPRGARRTPCTQWFQPGPTRRHDRTSPQARQSRPQPDLRDRGGRVMSQSVKRTFAVFVEDKPGVLTESPRCSAAAVSTSIR